MIKLHACPPPPPSLAVLTIGIACNVDGVIELRLAGVRKAIRHNVLVHLHKCRLAQPLEVEHEGQGSKLAAVSPVVHHHTRQRPQRLARARVSDPQEWERVIVLCMANVVYRVSDLAINACKPPVVVQHAGLQRRQVVTDLNALHIIQLHLHQVQVGWCRARYQVDCDKTPICAHVGAWAA